MPTRDEVAALVTEAFGASLGRDSSSGVQYPRKLRRTLLAALASDGADVGPAVAELCSEASHMFCHARSRLEHTHAALTDDQHRAVIAFLQRVCDTPDYPLGDRYLATIGLRWLWTRFGVDRARTAAFFTALRYRRPAIADPRRETLARAIEAAFEDTPYPAQITTADSDDERDIALLFHDQDWRTLHPDLVALAPHALGYFTAPAFRYFTPAYVLAMLAGEDLGFDVREQLSPADGRLAMCTDEERAALANAMTS